MGTILRPIFTVSLEMRLFLHQSMEHHSVYRPVVKFFTKTFSVSFRQKKAEIFDYF